MRFLLVIFTATMLVHVSPVIGAIDQDSTSSQRPIRDSSEQILGIDFDSVDMGTPETVSVANIVTDWPLTERLFGDVSIVQTLNDSSVDFNTTIATDQVGDTIGFAKRPLRFYMSDDGKVLYKIESNVKIQNQTLPSDPWEELALNAMNSMWGYVRLTENLPGITIDSALSMVRGWQYGYQMEAYYLTITWPSELEPETGSSLPGTGEVFWVILVRGFGDVIENYDISDPIPNNGKPYVRYKMIRLNGRHGNDVTISKY